MAMDINNIKVEPVFDYFERADVSTILSRCHPLGDKKAFGQRMSYAASYRGEWLAVLMFDKPVDFNKHREAKIGWSTKQVRGRRKHIANNSRFVVLPKYQGVPNLASKILSMVSSRISDDWLKRYGTVLLALETYVDPKHNDNNGTCYTAAGWENLGFSSGYLDADGERTHSKWYFLKPLHKDSYAALSSELPHALLTGVKEVSGKSNNNYVLDAAKINLKDLQKDLEQITDPRDQQGQRYKFVPLLSLCVSAVISGYTQYRQIADWIANLSAEDRIKFGLPGDRVPHESTIGDFLARIDPVQLNDVLTAWLLKTYDKNDRIKTVSLDGKVLRATSSNIGERKAFLNVFAHELGIVIQHVPTSMGHEEQVSAIEVLENNFSLNGKVVLADALHTDKNIIASLQKKTPRMSSLSKTIKNL